MIVDEIHAVGLEQTRLASCPLARAALGPLRRRRCSGSGCPPRRSRSRRSRISWWVPSPDRERPLIVDSGHFRERDLQLEVPPSPLEAVMSAEVWDQVYDRLAELIEGHRTTLIFVNTRRMAERVTRKLSDRLGESACRCASRQPRQGTAARRRAASEVRRTLGHGGDILARARHRYRRR